MSHFRNPLIHDWTALLQDSNCTRFGLCEVELYQKTTILRSVVGSMLGYQPNANAPALILNHATSSYSSEKLCQENLAVATWAGQIMAGIAWIAWLLVGMKGSRLQAELIGLFKLTFCRWRQSARILHPNLHMELS